MPDRSRFIREHAVCWEIAPHFELKTGHFRQVGFDVTLHAQPSRTDPGSMEAREMYAALHEIALEAIPEGVQVEIESYDASVHFRRETCWAAEIDLRAEVRHPVGTFDDVDQADRDHVRAIGVSLRKLGIPEGVYRTAA